ncbi:MAG: hypothetical protein B6247_09130 [Candidatus Parabeggiatoa sp. nov. 2]|nr:MAG: hypothetical protein B6247_09130 [Beggiatoa sp. 4572_84]
MRYIDKSNRCAEFDEYVNNDSPSVWDEFKTDIKLKLHQHLFCSQQGLCIYCQQEVPEKKETEYRIRSHIEHIRPRSRPQYAHKFLNPVECNEIEDYFVYDIEGKIHPNSSKNQEDRTKAEYMISILDLNHSKLTDIRKEQYQLIIEQQEKGLDIEEFLNPHYDLLPAFYAMLKQLFL